MLLVIGGTHHRVIYPVSAMLSYLCVRAMEKSLLFKFKDGRLLTRQHFVTEVREGLRKAGIDSAKYSGHSSDWGSYNCCCQSNRRMHHQDIGEFGVPPIC